MNRESRRGHPDNSGLERETQPCLPSLQSRPIPFILPLTTPTLAPPGLIMKFSAIFVPLLASLVRTCIAKSSTGNSVLVVLEKGLKKGDYSLFFDDLTSMLLSMD